MKSERSERCSGQCSPRRLSEMQREVSDKQRDACCEAQVDELDIRNLCEEQNKDEELAQLKELFVTGQLDTFQKEQIQHLSPRQRRLMIWAPQFRIVNDTLGAMFLKNEFNQTFKVIVPIHCYEQLINYTHATTLKHLGATKTIAYLKNNCILPGVDKIAQLCISKC